MGASADRAVSLNRRGPVSRSVRERIASRSIAVIRGFGLNGSNGSGSNCRELEVEDSKLTLKMSGMEAVARSLAITASTGHLSWKPKAVAA
jgi:hypothetical protein